jgi:type II secretory pathway pseudopilin PulG
MFGGKTRGNTPLETLKFLLIAQLRRSQSIGKAPGFTLIELLVGLVLAVLVITPLLGFMVNLMEQERQEQAKSQSEQELQTATDYISRDLQQAVYIYDAAGVAEIKDQLPTADDREPVLVFWKRKFVPEAVPLDPDNTNPATVAACNDDCNDTFVYSLVAYYLIIDDDDDNIWSDAARIGRFEIQDGVRNALGGYYTDRSNAAALPERAQRDDGFQFSLSELEGETLSEKLNNWEKDDTEDYTNTVEVLVDYIDETTDAPHEACPSGTQMVPDDTTIDNEFKTYSFYGCVTDKAANPEQNTAQVFIRGNALSRLREGNNVPDYSDRISAYFPTSRFEVEGRGKFGGD